MIGAHLFALASIQRGGPSIHVIRNLKNHFRIVFLRSWGVAPQGSERTWATSTQTGPTVDKTELGKKKHATVKNTGPETLQLKDQDPLTLTSPTYPHRK